MRKVLFLRTHPGWSPRDHDEAPQDVLDLMSAFDLEEARVEREQRQAAQRESAAATHRARIGASRGR